MSRQAKVADEVQGESAAANAAESAAAASTAAAEKLKRQRRTFAGTVNLYKSFGFSMPSAEERAKGAMPKQNCEEFTSFLASPDSDSAALLEVFLGKIKSHGYSRVKGPAGRVEFVPEIVEAFGGKVLGEAQRVVVAVWRSRVRNAAVEVAGVEGSTLLLERSDEGTDRSSIESRSGCKYVSFAALEMWADEHPGWDGTSVQFK